MGEFIAERHKGECGQCDPYLGRPRPIPKPLEQTAFPAILCLVRMTNRPSWRGQRSTLILSQPLVRVLSNRGSAPGLAQGITSYPGATAVTQTLLY